jgi:hypothetical protein
MYADKDGIVEWRITRGTRDRAFAAAITFIGDYNTVGESAHKWRRNPRYRGEVRR